MIKKFDDFIKESYNSNLGFIKPRTNFYLINESQESASQHAAINPQGNSAVDLQVFRNAEGKFSIYALDYVFR
jgi:hypothetical protein